ncbi:MAG: YjgN family protein, partial [Telluria sp.]
MHTLSDPPAVTAPPRTLALTFTGDGREYFRIWVVNLLLTLATLGIYSAWAKVRRLQYFDRNTHLAGATFDFHGNPKAVLVGRLLSVLMLAAYHYSFGFSTTFGAVVVAGLLLLFPYLMRGALRFRLGNTSYRGLRLGFDGSVAEAYLAWLPPALVVLLPGVLLAMFPGQPALAVLPLPFYLLWPLMHARIRRYQHAHLLFGDQHAQYDLRARRFFKPYLVGGGQALLAVLLAGTVAGFAGAASGGNRGTAMLIAIITAVTSMYVAFLLVGPYMVVRVSNLAWSHTSFPGLRFRSTLPLRAFMALQTKNAVLTVLSLGLYRPFAVVSVYRFR